MDEMTAAERKEKPQQQLNCPRCKSSNTKFCYYNNYSLSQPRYFCKSCRRYWTAGGSLRNIPVGGGSRKNRKSISVNPPTYQPHDLNLGFPATSSSSSSSSVLAMNPELQNNNQSFSSYIPNLMPYSDFAFSGAGEGSSSGYWSGMFGGGPPW